MDIHFKDTHVYRILRQYICFFEDGQNLSEEEIDQRCCDIVTDILESSNSDFESSMKFMQIERDVRYINTELDKARREGYQIGLEERLIEANEGERAGIMQKLIQSKYHEDAQWVHQCTSQQITKMCEIIFDDLSYKELIQNILQ